MARVEFIVYTDPAGQGSKVAVNTPAGTRMREMSKRVAPFRAEVRAAAVEAFDRRAPFTGPVALRFVCWHRRPAAHYGTGRNAGKLRPSAPYWKVTAPDLDKVARAIADALAGVAYLSDAQIAQLYGADLYVDVGAHGGPHVVVSVRELLAP